jgi:hypothetical protein
MVLVRLVTLQILLLAHDMHRIGFSLPSRGVRTPDYDQESGNNCENAQGKAICGT